MLRRARNRSRGQGIVEFALTLPILFVLVLGVIESGRLLFIYSAVNTASREAARYGSASGQVSSTLVNYKDCSGIRTAAKRLGFLAGIQDNQITITYDRGPGTTSYGTCQSTFAITSSAVRRVSLGDRVVVRVEANYQPIVPLVNFTSFTVGSTSVRTIVKDVPFQIQ
jgi:Flp pilus assembly protein TadG